MLPDFPDGRLNVRLGHHEAEGIRVAHDDAAAVVERRAYFFVVQFLHDELRAFQHGEANGPHLVHSDLFFPVKGDREILVANDGSFQCGTAKANGGLLVVKVEAAIHSFFIALNGLSVEGINEQFENVTLGFRSRHLPLPRAHFDVRTNEVGLAKANASVNFHQLEAFFEVISQVGLVNEVILSRAKCRSQLLRSISGKEVWIVFALVPLSL
jgi:hypothetical protein